MLALIAGTGELPVAVKERLTGPHLICAMAGFAPSVPVDVTFRIEHLGTFISTLQAHGVTEVCLAGAVRRPPVDPTQIDAATVPLVPQIQKALTSGDDGALRAIIAIFEDAGMAVVAANTLVPELIPSPGILTLTAPSSSVMEGAQAGDAALADMGARDSGQACIIEGGQVILREDAAGTDAMIQKYRQTDTAAFLMKGPKPNQDLRADMPVIGPGTVQRIIEVGLNGIVIEAGTVMMMAPDRCVAQLNKHKRFLWVRPRGGA